MRIFGDYTDEQVEALRADSRYLDTILVTRFLLVAVVGWAGLEVFEVDSLLGFYLVGVALLLIFNTYVRLWAGFPLFMGVRLASAMQRDVFRLTWWSGPPPGGPQRAPDRMRGNSSA